MPSKCCKISPNLVTLPLTKEATTLPSGPLYLLLFLKIWANPGLFFVYFRSFQTSITIFTLCVKMSNPSSIRCRDSNPRPLERETLPITTRPGLPPKVQSLLCHFFLGGLGTDFKYHLDLAITFLATF